MPTIKEIAELAGVSRGTVDRVLNNRGSVNAQTAQRVREIA
ncbi:MAG: LacI family DNA-binding transcriptional regulator, partial [Agathobacter sp.]|nr:LacI family DNA-binding transcriptional regulator [Agathobacter sp.]